MPSLTVEKGKDQGLSIELKKGRSVGIGRDASNELHLSDTLASRFHCTVESSEGRFVVVDSGSRNGTFLNGRRIHEADLSPNDQILVGETLITFLPSPVAADPLVGKEIGGYKILQLLGKGGMGRVYKALQLSLDRIVALKVLSKQYGDNEAFIERFRREAMALAQLNHPNIVGVYDVGSSDGYHYFSMEYMQGGNIAQRISKGRKLPLDKALPMMTDVARGLLYAEEKGIIHRDIKPENMMIDSLGNVKICDLGIAQSINESPMRGPKQGVFGSPHYIAPEQARGTAVDHRADIYSLGASFYRILSGRTMFKGSSAREIILKHLHEEPAPIQELESSLPGDVCRAIERMTAKDPEERYAGAADVIDALTSIEQRQKTAARLAERLPKRRRKRHSTLLVVLILAAIIGAGVLAAALWGSDIAAFLKQIKSSA